MKLFKEVGALSAIAVNPRMIKILPFWERLIEEIVLFLNQLSDRS